MRFLVTVTRTMMYSAEADSLEQAQALARTLIVPEDGLLADIVTTKVQHDPPLLLPSATLREYRIEYRRDGKLVYCHMLKRESARIARDRAHDVAVALSGMLKCNMTEIELRVQEQSPHLMIRGGK